ncbi:outer membrane beta-barrel family protein [Chitinophaga pendula]|uniref:outer membrane beta-barrel family protein n=1 Tax=Chitinophaga TaxID=79328 RepID=UPI000BAECB76|nr:MULTISPECIES: outer membrane beta-barrel family protein [Chitinophaga]ASZ12735.1 hypothetical protein CK934_18125 [Chitinophaga sp. MD30]UCJ09647.1 outer membrane beta-barrel family protein [Chitinophaga pendula]
MINVHIIYPVITCLITGCLLLNMNTVCAQQRDTTTRLLRTVNVITAQSRVVMKADQLIFRVDPATSAGTHALELLEQLPGVKVDQDNISLRGRPTVTIFIDDKPTYLQGSELAAYLRSLPAAMLEQIVVLSNPSARHDAAGNGGIINIRLKKQQQQGSSLQLLSEDTQGRYNRSSQSTNFGWRNSSWQLSGNANYYKGTGLFETDSRRASLSSNNKSRLQQNAFSRIPNERSIFRLSTTCYASPRTSWSIATHLQSARQQEYIWLDSRQSGTPSQRDTLTHAGNQGIRNTRNGSFAIGMHHQFDSSGHEWSADADYISYHQQYSYDNNNRLSTTADPSPLTERLRTALSFKTNIVTLKSDYQRPLTKNARLEAGWKTVLANTISNASYLFEVNGAPVPKDDRHNTFRYQEQVHAAYLSYRNTGGHWSLQMGLRTEHTRQKGTGVARQYIQLFPTAYISYKPAAQSDHQFNATYGRRIDRPGYTDLSPFSTPADRYTWRSGNPLLQPQLSDNIELAYLFRQMIHGTVFYNHLRNAQEETITIHDDRLYYQPANILNRRQYGASLSITWKPLPWWELNPSILYTSTTTIGTWQHNGLHTTGSNWDISLNQTIRFPHGWTATIMSNYTSTQVFAQYIQAGNWYIHAGVSKKIWQDKGTIQLNLRDIAYTRIDRREWRQHSVVGYTQRQWDTRNITVGISYQLRKGMRIKQMRKDNRDENTRLP